MSFFQENWLSIVVALLALSEVLASIPSVKSNSIFQLVVNLLKASVPEKKKEEVKEQAKEEAPKD